jgi:hypothetical protein
MVVLYAYTVAHCISSHLLIQSLCTLPSQTAAVLVDPKSRARYNDWKFSPTRYQFVANQQWQHPIQMYENLTQASVFDKTRLLVLVTVCALTLLVQPILICTKVNTILNHNNNNNNNQPSEPGRLQDASWLLLLVPLWVLGGMLLTFWFILSVITSAAVVILAGLEFVAWLTGCVLLACAWDGLFPSINWYVLAIPFYLGILLRILQSVVAIREARKEQDKMISPEYQQKLMHEYRDLLHQQKPAASADDEERGHEVVAPSSDADKKSDNLLEQYPTEEAYTDHLQEAYFVITLNQDAVASAITLMQLPDEHGQVHPPSEDEIELLRVHSSYEHMAMEAAIQEQRRTIYTLIAIGVTFVTLVAYKLEASASTNWWTIFTPFWVYFGVTLLNSCFMCCCVSITGDAVIVSPHHRASEDEHPSGQAANEAGADAANFVNASVFYAAAEGEMEEFHKVTTTSGDVDTGDQVSPHGNKDNSPSVGDSAAATEGPSTTAEVPVNQPSSEINADEHLDSSAVEPNPVTSPVDSNEDKGSADPDIDFEEAYYNWQNAHAQSQESAMEQQSKAVGTCCASLLQLIIVCCIVGKLQDATNNDADVGYNAFWILFPVFFLTGIVLCCCSCFIYGAGRDSLNIIVDRAKGSDEEADGDTPADASSEPIVPLAPAPTSDPATVVAEIPSVGNDSVAATATPAPDTAQTTPTDVEAAAVMDDLD